MREATETAGRQRVAEVPGWRERWRKEDWWAVWLGLGLVAIAYALYASGSSVAWLAVAPARWSTLPQLGAQFPADLPRRSVRAVAGAVHRGHGGPGVQAR